MESHAQRTSVFTVFSNNHYSYAVPISVTFSDSSFPSYPSFASFSTFPSSIPQSVMPVKKIQPNSETGNVDIWGVGVGEVNSQEFCCIIKSIIQRTFEPDVIDMASIRKEFNNNGRNVDENNDTDNKENWTVENSSVDSARLTVKKMPNDFSTATKLKKKIKNPLKENLNYCVFCMNNKERPELYMNHTLRNSEGKTVCPVLRQYNCPICNAKGDNAHTVRYCTKKPIVTMDQIPGKQLKKMYLDQKMMQPPSYRLGLRM